MKYTYLLILVISMSPACLLAEDWSAPASWQVEQRELVFEGADEVRLTGTLHLPSGTVPVPAVILAHGAGAGERDTPLYQQMAEIMPALGYAVFVYDRRGSGSSDGEDPAGGEFETLAEDAAAAHAVVSEQPEVDGDGTGFWGLSQGGWIGMKAAHRSQAAFVISVAAPLTTPGKQMITLTRNYMKIEGHDRQSRDQAEAVRRKAMDFTRGEAGEDETREKLEWAEDQPWFDHLHFPPTDEYLPMLEEAAGRSILGWDPVDTFTALNIPVLFMLGGEDFDIPVPRTLEILDDLPEQSNVEVVVIPGADHVMVEIEEPVVGEERKFTPNAPAYFLVMGHWLGQLGP